MNKNPIEKNMNLILHILGKKRRTDAYFTGVELAKLTNLQPNEINNALDLLANHRFVEVLDALGTAPYHFQFAAITSRGLYELERIDNESETDLKQEEKRLSARPAIPIGSPYGFVADDWEIVDERKQNGNELRVVFGCQFESQHYDLAILSSNLQSNLERAINEFNKKSNVTKVALHFQQLTAGYGEHLFNEIAREIISADIAVFDTSDLNPNVMLEMGVALTWGVRVLPIKEDGCPKPPSDISGQTWTDYRNSGAEFVDPNHHDKILAMIERAARRKGRV
jgi:hypothetical protein